MKVVGLTFLLCHLWLLPTPAVAEADARPWELQLSFAKGPETHTAVILPNVQVNWFPFGPGLYTGLSANDFLVPMHAGILAGYEWDRWRLEVSLSGTYFANPFTSTGEQELAWTVNPKLQVSLRPDDLGLEPDPGWNGFLKAGPGLVLWRESNLTVQPPALWNPELFGVPLNIEAGFGWRL